MKNLSPAHYSKYLRKQLGISEIDMTDEGGSTSSTLLPGEPAAIVSLIQSDPHCYSLTNTGKLR